MAVLNFYASPTEGRYGIRGALLAGETFGSWGAAVCVILLVKLPDNQLFCGHMACEYSGIPANEAIVKQKATALLDAAVGAGNKDCTWAMTCGSTEKTNTWMQAAMTSWFTNGPTDGATNKTDGYFSGVEAGFVLDNSVTGGTTEVNAGNFTVVKT